MSDKKQISIGDSIADFVSNIVKSWKFIIIQTIFIVSWIILNFSHYKWDAYPFSFLKLILIIEACFVALMIFKSNSRLSKIDRKTMYNDYIVDLSIRNDVKKIKILSEDNSKKISKIDKKLEK